MADSFSPHRSFPEDYRPSVAITEVPAEDSGTSIVSPPRKHAFGPLPLLSRGSEQIDSRTLDPLSWSLRMNLVSMYCACSMQPKIDL